MVTVLYIDDNPTNRRLVEKILTLRTHLTFLEASTGKDGLEMARRHAPQLILLDLTLPDLGGDEVLAELKADPVTRQTPVIVVSAEVERDKLQRLYAMGVLECLAKPVSVAELLALLDEAVPA